MSFYKLVAQPVTILGLLFLSQTALAGIPLDISAHDALVEKLKTEQPKLFETKTPTSFTSEEIARAALKHKSSSTDSVYCALYLLNSASPPPKDLKELILGAFDHEARQSYTGHAEEQALRGLLRALQFGVPITPQEVIDAIEKVKSGRQMRWIISTLSYTLNTLREKKSPEYENFKKSVYSFYLKNFEQALGTDDIRTRELAREILNLYPNDEAILSKVFAHPLAIGKIGLLYVKSTFNNPSIPFYKNLVAKILSAQTSIQGRAHNIVREESFVWIAKAALLAAKRAQITEQAAAFFIQETLRQLDSFLATEVEAITNGYNAQPYDGRTTEDDENEKKELAFNVELQKSMISGLLQNTYRQ